MATINKKVSGMEFDLSVALRTAKDEATLEAQVAKLGRFTSLSYVPEGAVKNLWNGSFYKTFDNLSISHATAIKSAVWLMLGIHYDFPWVPEFIGKGMVYYPDTEKIWVLPSEVFLNLPENGARVWNTFTVGVKEEYRRYIGPSVPFLPPHKWEKGKALVDFNAGTWHHVAARSPQFLLDFGYVDEYLGISPGQMKYDYFFKLASGKYYAKGLPVNIQEVGRPKLDKKTGELVRSRYFKNHNFAEVIARLLEVQGDPKELEALIARMVERRAARQEYWKLERLITKADLTGTILETKEARSDLVQERILGGASSARKTGTTIALFEKGVLVDPARDVSQVGGAFKGYYGSVVNDKFVARNSIAITFRGQDGLGKLGGIALTITSPAINVVEWYS